MTVINKLEGLDSLGRPLHLAMGVFDGVHIGHQEVVRQVIDMARADDGIPAVLTFDPFPLQVIAPDKAPQKILANIDHKQKLLEDMGVECLVVIPFDAEIAQLSAEEFLDWVHGGGRLAQISIGEDWKFGKGREGKLDFVKEYCDRHGITLSAVPPVIHDGERISSTRIRQAIRDGHLEAAAAMLGRRYSLYGTVEKGDQLGRKIGFPTANVDTKNELLPPDGVYAALAIIEGRKVAGVANLGVRPTVSGHAIRKLEVHLFSFDDEIYGQSIEVMLGEYLRGEQKFSGIDSLKNQIAVDCERARAVEWEEIGERGD